ncbi:MAG: glycoside hydrolase family 20 protein [Bacteroidales bacterium]
MIGLILLTVLSGCGKSATEKQPSGIIPAPVKIEYGTGKFVLTKNTVWKVETTGQEAIARQLIGQIEKNSGYALAVSYEKGDILFKTDAALAPEAYTLNVTPATIEITAAGLPGFYYATQSLRQLLPGMIADSSSKEVSGWSIPVMSIADQPRFEYRGLMLDVSRFFIQKETVIKIIDAAAMMKINKLHMHLVDDNGWRLEIKKYPELTEVGAWRVDRKDYFPARKNQQPGESVTNGGFYTQQEMKEIVAYAAARQIEVIPEIEMPAHTNASLAAYPDLACPVAKKPITVLPGIGGKNSEIIYCAGNERVFEFLEDVIDEVTEIFPSEYIHLGGDEASKTHWKACPKCQARMKAERIPNEEELQSYFMKRMCKYVQQKGKKPMGWDELTNSELPDGVTIFGWQGFGNAALKAARQGHPFIMTPARILYLVRYQGPQWFEPRAYFGNNTLKDVYEYEPVQKEWQPEEAALLKGIQASLWTEFCNSSEDVEYMIFPRLAALAEAAWIPASGKDWPGFLSRLDHLTGHWEQMGINYAHSMFNLDHMVLPAEKGLKVAISSIRPDLDIRFTTDGSTPDAQSASYTDTLMIDKSVTLKAATFRNGKQMGQTLTLPLQWNKATGKKVTARPNADRLYALTNGVRGSDKHSDFEWCGWYDTDFSFVVDLGTAQTINEVKLGSVTNHGMAVHIPASIELLASDDNQSFSRIGAKKYNQNDIFAEGIYVSDHHFMDLNAKARYIKIVAKNPGVCPQTHVRPNQKIWVYFDEIIIE